MAGVPGQIVCNVATVIFILILILILVFMLIAISTKILSNQAPGSFGCTMNTLHCYMESCGLVNLPRLP